MDAIKKRLGEYLATKIENNSYIGVGTGTTVDAALVALGARIESEGLEIKAVTTSYQSALRCAEFGIQVIDLVSAPAELDWGFDGADEVDARCRLIKGKGGAMLVEKIVASKCKRFSVLVTEDKIVDSLGEKFAVPVEVFPEALSSVSSILSKLPTFSSAALRDALPQKHGPVITEKGNLIIDVKFTEIPDTLEDDLKKITGVIDSGLFLSQATEVLVASKDGVKVIES